MPKDTKSKRVEDLLCNLHYLNSGRAGRFTVSNRSAPIGLEERKLRDELIADGVITETRHGSLVLTQKGVDEAVAIMNARSLEERLQAPFPENPEEVIQELDYWARRQHDGEPGSNHWVQAQARIDHLRYLNQRSVETQEMAKRSKARQSTTNNKASRLILAQLLSEFRQRKLTTDDLYNTYKGLSPNDLKDRCVAEGISEVDFDLAMSDLTSSDLIDTGPKEHVKNDPYSGMFMIGFFTSKNEYSYLTANGYREAVRLESNGPLERSSSQEGHATIIHGDQFNNFGQVAAMGTHSEGTIDLRQRWTAFQNEVDLHALTYELEQLRRHLQQSASSSSDYQRLALISEAEEHAKKRDGGKALEVLSKVGKGALDVAKDIGTEIAAKVIAKSMGIEP